MLSETLYACVRVGSVLSFRHSLARNSVGSEFHLFRPKLTSVHPVIFVCVCDSRSLLRLTFICRFFPISHTRFFRCSKTFPCFSHFIFDWNMCKFALGFFCLLSFFAWVTLILFALTDNKNIGTHNICTHTHTVYGKRRWRKKEKKFRIVLGPDHSGSQAADEYFFISFIYKLRGGWKCVLQMLFVFDNSFFSANHERHLANSQMHMNFFFHSISAFTFSSLHILISFHVCHWERTGVRCPFFTKSIFHCSLIFDMLFFINNNRQQEGKKSRNEAKRVEMKRNVRKKEASRFIEINEKDDLTKRCRQWHRTIPLDDHWTDLTGIVIANALFGSHWIYESQQWQNEVDIMNRKCFKQRTKWHTIWLYTQTHGVRMAPTHMYICRLRRICAIGLPNIYIQKRCSNCDCIGL